MKRGSKKITSDAETAESSSAFPPWAAWCRLVSDDDRSAKKNNFSQGFRELAWVRGQVSSVINVADIACEFSSEVATNDAQATGKRSSNAMPMIDRPMQRSLIHPSTAPSTIFLASCNRSDPIDRAAAAFKVCYPEASLQVVLGEWWAGHRRTWPIAMESSSVYWHQCHDVLLPKLLKQSGQWESRQRESCMALVVSEDSSVRQMWLDVLPQLGFHALAASNARELPEGRVDVVVYDQVTNDSLRDSEALGEFDHRNTEDALGVAALRRTYPDSRIVACFGFPRWNEVSRCVDSGADIVLGKPFHLQGLSTMLAEWIPK